jgi:very-short-patch-repair endonuclease
MRPLSHLQGQGCQKCYDERRGQTRLLDPEVALKNIKEAYESRGKHYDLSKAKYVNNKTKITIICPEHGEFQTKYNKIINRGDGCKKCANIQNGINKRLTTEEFIEKATKVHHGKYGYSKANYKTSTDKVTITCPIHGDYEQVATIHLSGCGCPKCNQSKLEIKFKGILDEQGIKYVEQAKFDWLGTKSLDFYLPEYNIAIECQGGQHLFEVEHFGVDEGFNKVVSRDIEKNKLCNENGIRILYYIEDINKKFTNNSIFKGIYNSNNLIIDSEVFNIQNYL